MSEISFALIPYPDSCIPAIRITGTIHRARNFLTVQFFLTGDKAAILFPAKATSPSRKDELWMATCFEFFLARPGLPHYWEFNLSPSGDWNVFHMDSYRREGFREEHRIRQLPIEITDDVGHLSLKGTVDLSPILAPGETVQTAVTSVIQTKERHETYWALSHPGPQADFHLREGFTLVLGGSDLPGS